MNLRGVQNFNAVSENIEYDGFELEEDPNDDEFFDDVITGRQSMSGDDSTWEITKNMSPELLSLFGVTDSAKGATNTNTKIAWQAPAKSGLDNSDPIIRTAFNYTLSTRGGSSQNGSDSMKSNVEKYSYNIDDDYDEDDDDLLKYYSDAVNETLTEFLDDVIVGKQNMSGDDSTWAITQNMSPALLALFGLEGRSASATRNKVAWQAPAKNGLTNSEPILRTAYNTAPATIYSATAPPSRPPTNKDEASGSRFRRNYDFSPEEGVVKRSGYNPSANSNISNNVLRESLQTHSVTTIETLAKDHEDDDGEEDGDEDDDDDDSSAGDLDMEEDEDAYADRILSMMSNNLKVAVGVRASDAPLATDWRPPAHSGLQNSDRIIR